MALSQPAAFRPKVTGTACCIQVRPATGVRLCCLASPANASDMFPNPASMSSSALRSCSTSPVSIASWLVAPQCTKRAASGSRLSTSAVSALTIGIAGFPAAAEPRDSATASNSSPRHCASICDAAGPGIRPACAVARASAASKSSMPCRRPRSEKISRTSSVLNSASSKPGGLSSFKPCFLTWKTWGIVQ